MTQDEIIAMARQAGLFTHKEVHPEIVAFAKLVAEKATAAEREACANMVDHILKEGGGTWGDAIRARGEA